MMHVLDTTVLIDHLRGRPVVARVAALRSAGDLAATTAINVEEITRGLRTAEEAAARHLFSGLVVLPVDGAAGRQAGQWRQEFAQVGTTLSQADCLIAATAFIHSATLATGNPSHFPMAGLAVQHWPVGV